MNKKLPLGVVQLRGRWELKAVGLRLVNKWHEGILYVEKNYEIL